MQNVAPSRALERRGRQLLQLSLVVIVVGIFLTVVGIAFSIIRLAPPTAALYNILLNALIGFGVIVLVIGIGLAIRAITWRTDNNLALITGEFLDQYLDDEYTFIRNISKYKLGYIDAVLVGPPGALVFRITDYEGEVANEGADWVQKNERGDFVPAPLDVTREAVVDVKALRDYLGARGLVDIPVFGVVVFTKEEPVTTILVKEPVVPVSYLSTLMDNLQSNYMAKNRISAETANDIVGMLYDV